MAIVNLRQASAHLGFRTTTTLRRLLQAGELSAYVRSGPDLRATYLDVAPKGRPTLLQHVQAHTDAVGTRRYGVRITRAGRSRVGIGLMSPTAI